MDKKKTFEKYIKNSLELAPKSINSGFKKLKLDKPTRVSGSSIKYIQSDINKPLQQELSHGQQMLQELMGGSNQCWGTGKCLPKINQGGGIDRNDSGQTASMFGIIK